MDKRLNPCPKCGTRDIHIIKSNHVEFDSGPAWGISVMHEPECELVEFKFRDWEPSKSRAIKRWNNFTRWDYK